jgi:hypothetical protein
MILEAGLFVSNYMTAFLKSRREGFAHVSRKPTEHWHERVRTTVVRCSSLGANIWHLDVLQEIPLLYRSRYTCFLKEINRREY